MQARNFAPPTLLLFAAGMLWACSTSVRPQSRPTLETAPTVQQPATKAAAVPANPTREKLAAQSLGGKELPYRVLLPADYASATSRRYPVLYLLHGLTGNENDWWERSRAAEYAARYHLIVVTPGVGDSWYANSATDQAARYEDAIVRDLIPQIDAEYRTVATREGRAVAGLSMGGLGALKFALRYPELFAFAASFSGAFDVPLTARLGSKPSARMLGELRKVFGDEKSQARRDNDLFTLVRQGPPKGASFPYLYVSTGKSDPLPQVADSNPRLAEMMRARKLKHEYYERPGTHDWKFWDSELEFMLGRLCVMMPQICS
ncbi:MAG TPA: alpha/beta hydrolase family protein [Pyrinomonadaceae bacterium]|nr:alpha/beta hydrolase family protein [Pyrinomonadaceae bacterium]